MNYSIKFKVWNIHEKYFYEKFLITPDGKIKEWINGNDYSDDPPFWGDCYANVIIQQFTGITDKNNREIYNGDIVKFTTESISKRDEFIHLNCLVEQFQGLWTFNYKGIRNDLFYFKNKLEVIGNSMEDPKLLELS